MKNFGNSREFGEKRAALFSDRNAKVSATNKLIFLFRALVFFSFLNRMVQGELLEHSTNRRNLDIGRKTDF